MDSKAEGDDMIQFKTLVALVAASVCASCASYDTTLTRPDGKQFHCAAKGFGIIGTTVATIDHNNCLDKAKEKGYVAN